MFRKLWYNIDSSKCTALFALWSSTWYTFINTPCDLEKDVYSLSVRCKVLYLPNKSSVLTVQFRSSICLSSFDWSLNLWKGYVELFHYESSLSTSLGSSLWSCVCINIYASIYIFINTHATAEHRLEFLHLLGELLNGDRLYPYLCFVWCQLSPTSFGLVVFLCNSTVDLFRLWS